MFRVCLSYYLIYSWQPCGHLLGKGWERADLLALLFVMFSCVFVTFALGVVLECIHS